MAEHFTAHSPKPDNGQIEDFDIAQPPADLKELVQGDVALAGGEIAEDPDRAGSIGSTMFDLPGSEDNSITVLLPQAQAQKAPSQALVRIKSRGDGRRYLGMVTAGPFAQPNNLRADSPLLLTVTVEGGIFLPPYHGRVQVTILGEELANGSVVTPRLRPLPNSPVSILSDADSARVLRTEGDLQIGLVVGHGHVPIGIPSDKKGVLPRHLAVLGTTGGGKSTTVARLIEQAQAAGMAVILLDVEGEYTCLNEPADEAEMVAALKSRGLEPAGIVADRMKLYHLIGRDTTNPAHPNRHPFSLQFARLSPYTVMEMLNLNDAQTDRYLFAHELAKVLMRDLDIFPNKSASAEQQQKAQRALNRLDEFDRGYPRLELSFLLDVVGRCKAAVTKSPFTPFNESLRSERAEEIFKNHLNKDKPTSASSWGKVHSLLWRLHRLKVFDRHRFGGKFLTYAGMLQPGQLSVLDLSDAGLTELSNIAVADVVRGIQEAQEHAYRQYEAGKTEAPPRVLLIIEEAHEFLSAERIERTPHLFQQIARIAKRGRKRWLSLVFVTQLPQHLPRAVFGLCNNFVLHKLTDPQVVQTLSRTIGGIDDSLWTRLPGLTPGQAIVSFGHMARPLLAAIDPAPCKLRMMN